MAKKYKYYSDIKSSFWVSSYVKRQTLLGFTLGLIFPLISWTLEVLTKNYDLSLKSIFLFHIENQQNFLIDLIPFVIAGIVYMLSVSSERVNKELKFEVEELNGKIQKNANFANLIGKKDFSRKFDEIDEDDELGKALLRMKNNLELTENKENEQNWIAKGKEHISNILRLHNNIDTLAYETTVNLIDYTKAVQGAFYIYDDDTDRIINIATYAYNRKKYISQEFRIGQGLIGQCAYEMDFIYRKEIPKNYVTITSGILGDKKPQTILIVPLISNEKLQGIVEFASLEEDIPELTIKFVRELATIIAQTVFNLKVNAKTEKLLKEARIMTEELKENEEELRQNAEEMRATQEELQKTNINLEKQIKEVENSQKRLHSLLENASEVISIYDENGLVKYESPSVKNILGYAPEEIIGKSAFETVHTSENNITKRIFFELLENPEAPRTFEYQYTKNDEETLWLESTGRNFLNNSAIAGIIFNTRDITVRKIAEKAQRMSGQMQALSENSIDMIIRINLEGRFFYVNPQVEEYTGVKKSNLIRRTLEEVGIEATISRVFKTTIEKIAFKPEKLETEFEFESNIGHRFMQLNAIPEFSEDGDLETVLLVAHDITEQKKIEAEIIDKNKKINDSINYAQRIQKAILPDNKLIHEYLPNSFILYKPRDVVSGDFPWFFKKGDDIYIAAVDCTGHGVPGALLSFIGYFLLNNIVDHDREFTAGEVLDKLHEEVRTTLKQDQEGANARDGMDIALCKINRTRNELQYSGAHRPLYLLREGELVQYRGSPKAIGGIPNNKKDEKPFINHVIKYQKSDKIFFFSDGLPDQIGGDKGRKYQVVRIRDEILSNLEFSMPQYMKHFSKDFRKWQGNYKQIDDVLMIGVEF